MYILWPYIYMEYTWHIPTIYLIGVPDVKTKVFPQFMAILLVKKLYKPGTYRYIPVCTIYTIVYRYIPVHTGTYRYVPKPLISYHWSGFQMALPSCNTERPGL
jgi:hypothetical protein